jgi:protein-S-isoprenylcysteine O-methyltransferase Ste14
MNSVSKKSGTGPKRDHPGVVAPPPLIFLICFAVFYGLGLASHLQGFMLPDWARWAGAGIAFLNAAVFIGGALNGFRKAKTPAPPWLPTTAIVTTGVYGASRNPMYLGMAMLYVALALALDSLTAIFGLLPALVIMHFGVILREERYLEAKFGEAYRTYKAAVRRWI